MATGGDFSRTLEGVHEPFCDFPCSLCENEGKDVEAVNYCEECFVFMCKSCVGNHQRFPLNKSHKLLQQSQFESVNKSKPVSFPTKRCLKRPNELINVYCGNHDVVCCSSCKTFKHSNCTKTQHLIDAAKGVQISQEYKNIKKETNIFLTDVVKVLAARNNDISRIDKAKTNIKQSIADFRNKVNKYFDDLEDQCLDELNNKAATIVCDCEQDKKDLAIMKSKAEDVLKQLESFTGDNECDLFVQVKTGKQFLSYAANKVHNISKSVQKDDINFIIDPRIEQFLSSVEVLGSFTGAHIASSRLATEPVDTNMNQPRTPIISPHTSPDYRDPLPKYKAQLQGKVDVKEKSDSVCHISNICQLPDGTILIVDYNNRKLKRLDDQSYKLLNSLRLPGNPHSVCNVGPGEVAVSLFGPPKVQFISIENKLALKKSFRTVGRCRGMVYVDGKLYVCCTDGNFEIYNKAGQLQDRIPHAPRGIPHAPRGIPSVPWNITVSDDDQHVLVTSLRYDDVTIMDLTGNVTDTFSDTNLNQPSGICTDGKGQVFICGYNSNTVVQLEPKQQKIDMILREEDGVEDPEAICYDRKQSRLLVSCRESNELLVFSLK